MPDSTVENPSINGADISLIEAKLPESILLDTEQLYDAEIPIAPRRVQKDTYETIISDKGLHFETTISLSGSKLKTHQCNCVQWSTLGVCKHVGASIIAIRKLIDKEAETQKKNSRKKRTSTFDRILQKLPSEELLQFIESYQRKDKVFKLLLTSHFANYLSQEDISALIESAFPVLKKAHEKVTPSRINIFLKVASALDDHFKNYISQEDFRKGYQLNYLLLKKSFYIKSKLTSENNKFFDHHKKLLANFIETLKLIEAPEYKAIIYDQLTELLSRSYISAEFMEEHLLWLALYQEPTRRSQLSKAVSIYWNYSHEDVHSFYFIKSIELLLHHEDREQLIDSLDPQSCYRIIKILMAYEGIDGTHEVLGLLYTQKRLQHQLANQILSISSSRSERFRSKTIDYYLFYKKPVYIRWLQETSKKWAKEKSQIRKRVEAAQDHFLTIQYYMIIEDFRTVASELKKASDFELVKKFDVKIAEHNIDLTIDIYQSLLSSYLDDHYGNNAIEYGEMVLHRAIATLGKIHSDKIKRFLDVTYPDRKVY